MPDTTPSDETPTEKPRTEQPEVTSQGEVTEPADSPEATAERPAVDAATPEETAVREPIPAAAAPETAVFAAQPAESAGADGAQSDAVPADAVEPEPAKRGKGGKIAALGAAGALVLLGGAYVVAHQVSTGKVPQGSTVAGVEIGGQSIEEARETLVAAFEERAEAPITATVDGADASVEVEPSRAGLSFDHDETLEQAGASTSWSPRALWAYFTGGDEIEPAVDVDESTFSGWVDTLDDEHGVKVREGKLRFEDGEIVVRKPRTGQVVDREESESALRTAFTSEQRTAVLPIVEDAPEIGTEQIKAARAAFAEPATSGPVTLTSGDVSLELEPFEYTAALEMKNVEGELKPSLKSKALSSLIKRELAESGGPQEATVKLVNGTPQVVADKKGVSFDQDEVDQIFLDLVAAPEGERSAEVNSVEARSDFTTEDAEKLNIVERVSTFETRYPYAEYRNVNIGRAAELIDGTVLKPGETFSLNEVVGERTRENGFTTGIMIADGVFKEDLGGGVSQMATTVFNSMFFAGLEDVEHKPHSFYISRYPVGREATVAWGSVDLKFRNNTPHGVLVEAKVQKAGPGGQGVVRVSMWSTKMWDITTSTSGRYALTSPKTRTLSGPTCMPNSGYGGFNVDVKRYFAKPGSGKIEKTENFRTTYTPSDTVICE